MLHCPLGRFVLHKSQGAANQPDDYRPAGLGHEPTVTQKLNTANLEEHHDSTCDKCGLQPP